MTKEPGGDSPGGVTFRLGWWAMLPSRLKPQESNPLLRVAISGYDTRTSRVTGGVAWTKWLTTLTGESPTSSARAPARGGNAKL